MMGEEGEAEVEGEVEVLFVELMRMAVVVEEVVGEEQGLKC